MPGVHLAELHALNKRWNWTSCMRRRLIILRGGFGIPKFHNIKRDVLKWESVVKVVVKSGNNSTMI